jgi:hypothetical protein
MKPHRLRNVGCTRGSLIHLISGIADIPSVEERVRCVEVDRPGAPRATLTAPAVAGVGDGDGGQWGYSRYWAGVISRHLGAAGGLSRKEALGFGSI